MGNLITPENNGSSMMVVTTRLPVELVQKVDFFAKKVKDGLEIGGPVGRSTVLRFIIERHVDRELADLDAPKPGFSLEISFRYHLSQTKDVLPVYNRYIESENDLQARAAVSKLMDLSLRSKEIFSGGLDYEELTNGE